METSEINSSGYTAKMFEFEKSFDEDEFHNWMLLNWTNSFWYSGIYVVMIMGGRKYMEKRQRFDLRWPLIIWSGILAIFSIFGAIRTFPELVYVIRHHGFNFSVCNPSYFYAPTGFWAYMFTISKVYELGDTIFIVLRKQPMIFLHWYHHSTVMIYVWYSYTERTAPGRWFMVMNYMVHSFMYTYYTMKAFRFRIPKFVSIFITSIQILQMIVGIFINLSCRQIKAQGLYCQQSIEITRYCLIMYCSYFILFCYFFYTTYIKSTFSTSVKKSVEIKQTSFDNNCNALPYVKKLQ